MFLDGVFIPDDLLVSTPGNGWKLARTTLANERVSLSNDSSSAAAARPSSSWRRTPTTSA